MPCSLSPVVNAHAEPPEMAPVPIVFVEIVPLTRRQHRRPQKRLRRHEHVVRMRRDERVVLHVTRDPLVPHAGTPRRRRRRRQRPDALRLGRQRDLAPGRGDLDGVEVGG